MIALLLAPPAFSALVELVTTVALTTVVARATSDAYDAARRPSEPHHGQNHKGEAGQ